MAIHWITKFVEEDFTLEISKGKAGLFCATSPDLKGFFIAEKTLEELFETAPFVFSEFKKISEEIKAEREQRQIEERSDDATAEKTEPA